MKRRDIIITLVVSGIVALGVARGLSGDSPSIPPARINAYPGVAVTFIVTPSRAAELPAPLAATFDVTAGGHLVVRGGDALLELSQIERDLYAERLPVSGDPADSFAVDGHGLLSVSGHFFGQWEADGRFSAAVPLPAAGMQLQSSVIGGRVYLFGQGELGRRLYQINEDGRLRILCELPQPIVAVADTPSSVYVGTAQEIYRFSAQQAALIFRLPEEDTLTGLAAPADEQLLYFATDDHVYALRGLAAVAVLPDVGGALRQRGDELYVWDALRLLLLRVDGLERRLLEGP